MVSVRVCREKSLQSKNPKNISINLYQIKFTRPGEITGDFSEICFCDDHQTVCKECVNHIETFSEIDEMLDAMDNKWLKHKFKQASHDILQLKMHQLRAVHQDRAKTELLDRLSEKRALIIFDFAMKYLPQKYRKAQVDFFGKKGLSWHVMVCIWKTSSGDMHMKTIVYLMGHVKQVHCDMFYI